jgi:Na+/H+ antiporter NhaD/arsenite permease-like protein
VARNIESVNSSIKENIVVFVAIIATIITMFFIKPDKEYLNYFDFKTLTCLFCILAVICALKNIYFFEIVSHKIVTLFKTTRSVILAFIYITFIGSMLITNDMALIIFLTLGYYVLHATNQKKYLTFTFIMQNMAANLGGMLTPFGNPQNLYLYTFYNISYVEFIRIMFIPFIVSIILITICCLFVFINDD